MCFQLFFFGIATVLGSCQTNARTEAALSARIIEALKAKEPGWTYHRINESQHNLAVPSEKDVLIGLWFGPNHVQSRSQDVEVHLHSVETTHDAVVWLSPWREKKLAEGWSVSAFQIGEEGYLATHKDGGRFSISFRKGSVVANMLAADLNTLKEFALCVVASIPPN
jgi:hypothetical protein